MTRAAGAIDAGSRDASSRPDVLSSGTASPGCRSPAIRAGRSRVRPRDAPTDSPPGLRPCNSLAVPSSSGQLVQVRQDFSRDPGWDHYQNRIVGTEMPAVVQDFGWRRTGLHRRRRARSAGASRTRGVQAYYAMPLGRPLTFDDELSASGKLALRHIGLRGVGYVGFFNSRRHTWRVWNSMAFRVWEEDGLGQVMFDWMSADWKARGAETAILLQPDGEGPHLELPLRARGAGRSRLARRGPRAARDRSHRERPAVRAPGRGAPVRAAEEGGAGLRGRRCTAGC